MAKPFFEVFPSLKLSDLLRPLMELALVERVSMNRDRTRMQIFLTSERLIQKEYIYETERAVKSQLFSGIPLEVKIIERFYLSRQYTAANLMPVYEDSILMELKSYNSMLYHMLRGATKEFEEADRLCLTLQENVVSEQREGELLDILEKIFCERCGLPLHVSIRHEKRKSSRRDYLENELEMEIARISRRAGYQGGNREEDMEASSGISSGSGTASSASGSAVRDSVCTGSSSSSPKSTAVGISGE